MSDAEIRDLAQRAGVSTHWIDYAGNNRSVSIDVLRRILTALNLPCQSSGEREESRRALERTQKILPPMLTATQGRSITIPIGLDSSTTALLVQEDGQCEDLVLRQAGIGSARAPPIETVGYHRLEIGGRSITLAVAPARCYAIENSVPEARLWGLVVQVHGLRRVGDCGIGDMGAVAELARSAARRRADALALSPTHAMFAADPSQFSPYSPSSRLFYNVLHADPRTLFSNAQIAKAMEACSGNVSLLEAARIIDWPRAASAKLALFRHLFADFSASEATTVNRRTTDFARFRAAGGELLEQHACFEVLHAMRTAAGSAPASWRHWPVKLRDPSSAATTEFVRTHQHDIRFHCFLQWLADRSLAHAQRAARQSGMRIGLIADLAVGMSGDGSHAWARQSDILVGLSVGAPPDLFNARGQNWGLTTFSPRALVNGGFAPFIDTLRTAMRHAGGLRIDHIMGLMRLWVLPEGVEPDEGAYLAYPLDDLLRLLALESSRHRAIVIGEDLGTVPEGFRDRLADAGIAGMRVLWFERDGKRFTAPRSWPEKTIAMTSTHDLPTVAGWWSGADVMLRRRCNLAPDPAAEQAERTKDRAALWRAFRNAKAAAGPQPKPAEASRIADAAVQFIADTPSELALLPMEDALALENQANLPGTVDEYPNWRARYESDATRILDAADVRVRLRPLEKRSEP